MAVHGQRMLDAFILITRARRYPLRPTTGVRSLWSTTADGCQDETVLRIYGGHMIRVPFSLDEVLCWLG